MRRIDERVLVDPSDWGGRQEERDILMQPANDKFPLGALSFARSSLIRPPEGEGMARVSRRGFITASSALAAAPALTAMQAAGHQGDTLGEVTGTIPELLG